MFHLFVLCSRVLEKMDAIDPKEKRDTFLSPGKDEVAISHNDRAIWESREPYGPAGKKLR